MRTVHNISVLKERRQELRNKVTPQETILWSRLKDKMLGFKFRRQHSIGNYIVDFCCPEKKLIVELDGFQHGEKDNVVYDEERTAYLHELGYSVFRFWNNEVDSNLEGVLLKINSMLHPSTISSSPPQLRRGAESARQGGGVSFFDIHTHTNFAAFDTDREEVMARAQEMGVAMINVGTQKDTSTSAIALSEQYEGAYAAVGLHPIHTSKSFHDEEELGAGGKEFTSRGEEFDYDYYKKLARHPKVVAIGECGLDYYRVESGTENQEENFRKQIELAIEVNKPLMLHIRQAYADAYEILKNYAQARGNLHFFAGTIEDAKPFLDRGFSFSFTGVITFARQYDEVVRFLPLDRIMSETDAPYVAPAPYRGKRNEPAYVVEVVKKIAEIRGEDDERVRAQLVENARIFFSIA